MIRERHTIKNEREEKIVWLLEKPGSEQQDHVVVLCHWRSVDKDELGVFTTLADRLIWAWEDVFRFDYRGSGQSDWADIDVTVLSEKEDTIVVCDYLAWLWYKQVTLLAASFAWGPVVLARNEITTIKKKWLILRNAMTEYTVWREKIKTPEYQEMLNTQWFIMRWSRKFRAGKACFDQVATLNPYELLATIEEPMLLIHGTEDVHIPIEDAVRHSEIYWIPLIIVEWAKHGFHDIKKREIAMRGVVEFVWEY